MEKIQGKFAYIFGLLMFKVSWGEAECIESSGGSAEWLSKFSALCRPVDLSLRHGVRREPIPHVQYDMRPTPHAHVHHAQTLLFTLLLLF